ncbi:MAG: hypothetical protein AB7J13_08155 [Pyrinomonadaceae bacterium]
MKIGRYLAHAALGLLIATATACVALADVPAPQTEAAGTDWGFVALGAVSAFLGALLFVWLGRKFFKR